MPIQLVVRHNDDSYSYYPVLQCWRIDRAKDMLIIDRSMPRTMVPLSNVKDITIEEVTSRETGESDSR